MNAKLRIFPAEENLTADDLELVRYLPHVSIPCCTYVSCGKRRFHNKRRNAEAAFDLHQFVDQPEAGTKVKYQAHPRLLIIAHPMKPPLPPSPSVSAVTLQQRGELGEAVACCITLWRKLQPPMSHCIALSALLLLIQILLCLIHEYLRTNSKVCLG